MASYRMLERFSAIELGGEVAVRYCGRLFSKLGANVVRVEQSNDDTQLGGGGPSGVAFGSWLDEGKAIVRDLGTAIAHLDRAHTSPSVVLAGQYPLDRERAFAAARAMPSRPPVCSAIWFDESGPYANWRGNDPVVASLCGLPYSIGLPEGPPIISPTHMSQILAGVNLFTVSLATLWARERGLGISRAETTVHEALMCFAEVLVPDLLASGRHSQRSGINRGATCQPTGIFRARDGWIGVCALTQQQWEGFCELVGRPDLLSDPRFSAFDARLQNVEPLWAEIAPILAARSVDDLAINGQKLRVPVTQVPDQRGLLESPHWAERESFERLSAVEGKPRAPGLPFRAEFDGVKVPKPTSRSQSPLAGLRIVDFSMGWAGPLATRILADLGADVIKVESRSAPDWIRGGSASSEVTPPPYEMNRMFAALNRNKRGILLDLRNADDLDQAKALISNADAVIDNFAPGVMEKLGLGPKVLRGLRPGLVVTAMSAFGAKGPWNFFRAYGITAEMASSLPFANGFEDWPPALSNLATGDPVAGLFGAAATLAALLGRDTVGGSFIDVAQVECVFQLGADALLTSEITKGPVPRTGNRRSGIAPSCVVAAKDKDAWLTVAIDSEAEWRALCDVIGKPDWGSDPEFSGPTARNLLANKIETAIAAWSAQYSPAEAASMLQAVGVPAAPVLPNHALADNPQLVQSAFWQTADHKYLGRHLMGAACFKLDGARPLIRSPAPLLGEHSEAILSALT